MSALDQAMAILPRVPELARLAAEWADSGVKGIDTSKVRVSGGSATNPTEAAALSRANDPWSRVHGRLRAAEWALTFRPSNADLGAAARMLIAEAAVVDARWKEITGRDLDDLQRQNARHGTCEWCLRQCGGSTVSADGKRIDNRMRTVAYGRSTAGLCNACYAFLLRRTPKGQPMGDVAHHDAIRAEREAMPYAGRIENRTEGEPE